MEMGEGQAEQMEIARGGEWAGRGYASKETLESERKEFGIG